MLVGQLALFGAIYTHDVIIYLVGTTAATLGTLGQKYVGRVLASPFRFAKLVRCSFYEDQTIVDQIRYRKPPTTTYGAQKCNHASCEGKVVKYLEHKAKFPEHLNMMEPLGPNWSMFALEDGYIHKKYGQQDLFIVEHYGEIEELWPPEPGEVAFAGAPDVEVNTCPIMSVWESPRTYKYRLHVYPVHVPAKGPPGEYEKWVHPQVAQTARESLKELAAFMR